jgi:hypothetical protein
MEGIALVNFDQPPVTAGDLLRKRLFS